MSQLNLKKILSSDNISTLVDTLNYNFDQIVLNGGGPQGLRGLLGAPGLPGLQGPEGDTGPTGIDGTYIYTASVGPSAYSFGASGENMPRNDDIFIEVQPSYINVWQNETGPSAQWNLVGVVTAPVGATKLIRNTDCIGATDTIKISMSNDPAIAGKVYFGDVLSFDPNIGIINDLDPNKFSPNYSVMLNTFGSPNVLTLGGTRGQMRILCSDPTLGLTVGSNFQNIGGGVIHSMEQVSGVQWYKIVNGDANGQKNFLLDLNYPLGARMMIGTTANKVCIGGLEGEALAVRLSVNNGVAIGNAEFYGTASVGLVGGIVSQGNLAVGRNQNWLATGSFFGVAGNAGSVLIDSDPSSSLSTAKSTLTFGTNLAQLSSGYPKNDWTFTSDSYTNIANPNSTAFYLQHRRILSLFSQYTLNYLYLKSQESGSRRKPRISIGGTEPLSLLDIGAGSMRTSIGDINWTTSPGAVDYMTNYVGFNLHRDQVSDTWIRKGDGGNNSGGCIWNGPYTNFNFSIFGTSGGGTATHTDQSVYNATKLTITANPGLYLSENISTKYSWLTGLLVDIGATGDLSDPTYNIGRRGVAIFGGGLSQSGLGTPFICDTKGVTHGSVIKPQYTFLGSDYYGMYLAQGITSNGAATGVQSVGLCESGTVGIHIGNTYGWNGTRIGLGTRNPHERVQIGDRLVIHDGENKVFGYNMYWGTGSSNVLGFHPIYTETSVGGSGYGAASWSPGSQELLTNQSKYRGFKRAGGHHDWNVFPNISSWISFNNEDTYTSSKLLLITSGHPGTDTELNSWRYRTRNFAPKLLLGFRSDKVYDYDDGTNYFLRRGSLSVVAQQAEWNRPLPSPGLSKVVDDYAMSLYNYQIKPVIGISPQVSDTATDRTYNVYWRLLTPNRYTDTIGEVSLDHSFIRVSKTYELDNQQWPDPDMLPGTIWLGDHTDSVVIGDNGMNTTTSFSLMVQPEPNNGEAAQFNGVTEVNYGPFYANCNSNLGEVSGSDTTTINGYARIAKDQFSSPVTWTRGVYQNTTGSNSCILDTPISTTNSTIFKWTINAFSGGGGMATFDSYYTDAVDYDRLVYVHHFNSGQLTIHLAAFVGSNPTGTGGGDLACTSFGPYVSDSGFNFYVPAGMSFGLKWTFRYAGLTLSATSATGTTVKIVKMGR